MHSLPAPLDSLLQTARAAASAASDVHRLHAGSGAHWTEEKTTSSDFVSNVDIAAQEAALSVISDRHPTHHILAEEEGGTAAGAGSEPFVWIVDPLDGTTNYLHRHPYYAASVAVWDDEGPLVGVVDAAALGKRWEAVRGHGASEDGAPMAVSQTTDLSGCLIGTGFPFKALDLADQYLGQFKRILSHTAGIRRAGAAAIDLAYVANGTIDAFWELVLHPWDVAAGVLLVTEAGGAVERLEGGPVGTAAGTVLAANSSGTLAELRHVALGTARPLD